MKLLFDQNLSHKLVDRVRDLYPDSDHVRSVGLSNATDAEVWKLAQTRGYVIVTKDEDFHVRSVLMGPQPKVLWIRSGNCSTDLVETLLRKNLAEVEAFAANQEVGFLTLL